MRGNSVRPLAAKEAEALFQLCLWLQVTVVKWNMRAHPDFNQGPADLQSAALTTELCTQVMRFLQLETSQCGTREKKGGGRPTDSKQRLAHVENAVLCPGVLGISKHYREDSLCAACSSQVPGAGAQQSEGTPGFEPGTC